MSPDIFAMILKAFLRRRPFLPFTLELFSGTKLEVNHPEALTLHKQYRVHEYPRHEEHHGIRCGPAFFGRDWLMTRFERW